MDLQYLLQECAEKDPTWDKARDLVSEIVVIPPTIIQVVRSAWNGNINTTDFIKLVSFSGIDTSCLLNAAEIRVEDGEAQLPALEKAINLLGIRFSAIVLAVNVTVRSILATKPKYGWRKLLENMINDIHIGYCFGNRSNELGVEGGALVGFSENAGLGILLAKYPKAHRRYNELKRQSISIPHELTIDLFGCEPYQVSAMLLQYLGFGVQTAVGAICGLSDLNIDKIDLDFISSKWKAAFQWIYALREGRDYPRDLEDRNAFPALKPSTEPNQKNPVLEMLYLDVVRVRKMGSPWLWHLPCADYNAVRDTYSI